jgi:hypothetical protein
VSLFDDFQRARAEVEYLEKPWLAYVGLVALIESTWTKAGEYYVCNFGHLGLFDLPNPFVVIHEHDKPELLRMTSARTDEELAACLYWARMEQPT